MPVEDLKSIKDHYKGLKLYAVVFAISTSLLLTSIDTSIVAAVMTPMIKHFNNYAEITAWIIPAYTLSTACCCLLASRIASVINLKYGVCLGISIFELGTIITASSANINMLFIGRCIAGIGSAFISNLVYLILIEIVVEEKLPFYMSIISVVFNMGTVLGPIIGSAFIDSYPTMGWRYSFWINLPIGFTSMMLILLAYNHHGDNYLKIIAAVPGHIVSLGKKSGKIHNWRLFANSCFFDYDVVEFLSFALGFVLLFLGLTYASGGVYPWDNYRVIILISIGAVLIFFAIVWDVLLYPRICIKYGETANPLIDVLCYKKIGLFATNLCIFCASFSFITILIYLIQFYQIVLEQSTLSKIIPLFVASSVSVIIGARFIERTGMVKLVIVVGSLLGCVGAGMLQLLNFNMTSSKNIGYTILAGVGYGSQVQSTIIAVQQHLTKEEDCITEEEKKFAERQRINVNSFYSFMRLLGMATGPVVGNTIFSILLPKRVHHSSDLESLHGYSVNDLVIYRLTYDTEQLNDTLGKIMLTCIKAVMWLTFCFYAINLCASLFLSGKKSPHKFFNDSSDIENNKENNNGDDSDDMHSENPFKKIESFIPLQGRKLLIVRIFEKLHG